MYDPDRYRDRAEIEQWKQRDPLALSEERLRDTGLADDEALQGIDAGVMAEVDRSVAFAEAGHDEPIADLLRFVLSDGAAGPSERAS